MPAPSRRHQNKPYVIVSTGAATAKPTTRYGRCATNRIRTDPRTKQYVARRQAEAKNQREITRCLKRHIAREIYQLITDPPPTPNCAKLRSRRQQEGITITEAAHRLNTQPTLLSRLERGLHHNHQLATRYQQWINTRQPTCTI